MFMALKRGIIVLAGVWLQISLVYNFYAFLGETYQIIRIIYSVLGFLLVLHLIKSSRSYSFILPWIVILLLFPVPGMLIYFILGRNKRRSKILKNIKKSESENLKYLKQDESLRDEIDNNGKLRYLSNYTGYPVTKNNIIDYYPLGDDVFKVMLEELKTAKEFIFFEYFIVAKGKMWDSILEILREKVKEGVDVRVMYDDLGCVSTLRDSYPKKLRQMGIKCVVFNKLRAFAGVIMNNRDHRKILVIDGKVAFSGGINISDEYINEIEKYGHWKDNAIRIKGESVWNYTVMFLTMWNAFQKEEKDKDFKKFKYNFKEKIPENGYVVPYGETPLDEEVTGEDVYLNIINQANKYVYIFTPYLIIDNNMTNALNLAAKRGVDVRIVIPGIPDKKMVYTVSESYIEPLIRDGVKVYKYTPGFVHSKVFVSDDKIATVGTINLDYRSLYLHFECGCYFENCDVVMDVKKDLVDTIKKCDEITPKDVKPKLIKAFWQAFLRILAPLM